MLTALITSLETASLQTNHAYNVSVEKRSENQIQRDDTVEHTSAAIILGQWPNSPTPSYTIMIQFSVLAARKKANSEPAEGAVYRHWHWCEARELDFK